MCCKLSSHRKPAEERDPTEPSARQQTERHASGDVCTSLPETFLDDLPMAVYVNAQNLNTKGGFGGKQISFILTFNPLVLKPH